MAAPPTGIDLEPPVPDPKDIISESPWTIFTFSGLTSKNSQIIWVKAVSCPCPFDWEPMCTVTSPVFSNMIVASSGPRPEQASIYVDKPMPLSFPFCSDFFLL